ncbi:hypothetical protein [Actinoplanes sp. NPDC049802]|uniref:hypothetical protein n=1 Tax=Actinoplanes sp. NPDC049802 TaxID=3154742 RepID=UPI0033FBA9A8
MSSHQPNHARSRRSGWIVPTVVATVLLTLGAATFVILTADDEEPEPALETFRLNTAKPGAPPSQPLGKLIENTPEPDGSTVGVTCFLGRNVGPRESFTFAPGAGGRHDFSGAWQKNGQFCDVTAVDGEPQEVVSPASDLEATALQASDYADDDIADLFAVCADVNPNEEYLEPGYAMPVRQSREMSGALVLCPDHPLAPKWRLAMQRGPRDLTPDSAAFGDGTHRVGTAVKPGAYTSDDTDGCYWERQSGAGKIVASGFSRPGAAPRVTLRATDHAFLSAGCGSWSRS